MKIKINKKEKRKRKEKKRRKNKKRITGNEGYFFVSKLFLFLVL
jgi:hypothetical protein